ncbi:hypothetical protein BGS_1256 [Beggiatoa sp. SS]|nr:hypothetical protein BGS_1256 [Beggiatoa sp. SS]
MAFGQSRMFILLKFPVQFTLVANLEKIPPCPLTEMEIRPTDAPTRRSK